MYVVMETDNYKKAKEQNTSVMYCSEEKIDIISDIEIPDCVFTPSVFIKE